MDVATACFLKKYYPNVIKWWLVTYNPESVRIWPSPEEKEEALRIEQEELLALEEHHDSDEIPDDIPDDAYNATTGSYSGLYGKKPVDEETQRALDAILGQTNSQNNVDCIFSDKTPVVLPEDGNDIVTEANLIYERLMQEAIDDENQNRALIDELLQSSEKNDIME